MGSFAAEFRGFWVERGCGAAIQRTADAAGLVWRKIFLKEGEKPKNWGVRGAERWIGGALYRAYGAIFRSGNQPLAALLKVGFVQVSQLRAPALRSQRFAPLVYGEPIRKLHRSLYGGASACLTYNFLTFTCGLSLPACRILVTTISSQSR